MRRDKKKKKTLPLRRHGMREQMHDVAPVRSGPVRSGWKPGSSGPPEPGSGSSSVGGANGG